MSESLRELEKRLRDEPDNLGLRVAVAGAMKDGGRLAEAVELYRSVAIAYRDQGREQQAIAVCRSLLAIAPGDQRCQALLASLAGGGTGDATPLPRAIPYHVHDPTTSLVDKLDFTTDPGLHSDPEVQILLAPTTIPIPRVDFDDELTPARDAVPEGDAGDTDDALTIPRDLPLGTRRRAPAATDLVSRFFAPLPADRRDAVLARFGRRTVTAGTTVIRQGETGHPLVIVTKGRLDLRVERASGAPVQVGSIAAGEYVGEAALLARQPAGAHVIAAIEAELLTLPARDLYELAGAFPALWAELKDTAERRTRELEQRLRAR